MNLTYRQIDLRLAHTFTIARSSRDIEPSIIVELTHDGITGLGEAAPSERYGESAQTVQCFLSRLDLGRLSFFLPGRLNTYRNRRR